MWGQQNCNSKRNEGCNWVTIIRSERTHVSWCPYWHSQEHPSQSKNPTVTRAEWSRILSGAQIHPGLPAPSSLLLFPSSLWVESVGLSINVQFSPVSFCLPPLNFYTCSTLSLESVGFINVQFYGFIILVILEVDENSSSLTQSSHLRNPSLESVNLSINVQFNVGSKPWGSFCFAPCSCSH